MLQYEERQVGVKVKQKNFLKKTKAKVKMAQKWQEKVMQNKTEIDYQNEMRRKALLKRQKEREEAVSMIQVFGSLKQANLHEDLLQKHEILALKRIDQRENLDKEKKLIVSQDVMGKARRKQQVLERLNERQNQI